MLGQVELIVRNDRELCMLCMYLDVQLSDSVLQETMSFLQEKTKVTFLIEYGVTCPVSFLPSSKSQL